MSLLRGDRAPVPEIREDQIPETFVVKQGNTMPVLGLLLIILCFVRAFSRQLPRRELENTAYLAWVDKKRRQWEGKKDRFRQRKDFKFFKCPGCGTILRVPRGKGKIHINCPCGYVLYRKT